MLNWFTLVANSMSIFWAYILDENALIDDIRLSSSARLLYKKCTCVRILVVIMNEEKTLNAPESFTPCFWKMSL